ncbi:MAG: NADH-quinone oxidoreductase subunit H [Thermoguttaceae bacterium]|nr:NADH-quinone oxidoreductase subunit H [Thermoguttaceae bacterium]
MTDHLIHVLLLVLLPPLLPGVIAKVKARFAGRVGPPVLQLYYDLFKLLRKELIASRTTTWVFLAGPAVGLVTVLLAGLVVPMSGRAAPIAFAGDMILFVYLMALGRFFTTAAAMDTGSAFEGMGAVREASFASLAEPATLLGFLALGRLAQSLSLSGMLDGVLSETWLARGTPLVFVVVGLFIVLLAENCRIPFDDPNTHLELTMIHEVMVLDHGGPALALVLYGAAVKLYVLGAIIVRIMAPVATGALFLDWAAFVAAMLALAAVVGVVESVMARLRLIHVPRLLTAACLLCGFGFVLLMR